MAFLAEAAILILWVRIIVLSGLAGVFYVRRRGAHAERRDEAGRPLRLGVIVPAYNEAGNIAPTLAALLAQSLPIDRIVVIDDGSVDATRSLAEAALSTHPDAKVIRLDENHGKANALNQGLAFLDTDLVATVDADTRLDAAALALAAARLQSGGADAVALQPVISARDLWLVRMQAHEYSASLNLERAGQRQVRAIAVLPGAASLFRRSALPAGGFSGRTRTEDADLTLWLARSGRVVELETRALADTLPPRTWRGLLRQRARWSAGHFQCAFFHGDFLIGRRPRHGLMALTYAGFAVSALAPLIFAAAFLGLQVAGGGPLTGLTWIDILGLSLILAYAQRATAVLIGAARFPGLAVFLVEPFFSSLNALVAAAAGLASLCLKRPRRAPGWTRAA